MISFILHRLESRTRPILTPYDGRRRWDSNLRTPACKSPALPLCYGRRVICIFVWMSDASRKLNWSTGTVHADFMIYW